MTDTFAIIALLLFSSRFYRFCFWKMYLLLDVSVCVCAVCCVFTGQLIDLCNCSFDQYECDVYADECSSYLHSNHRSVVFILEHVVICPNSRLFGSLLFATPRHLFAQHSIFFPDCFTVILPLTNAECTQMPNPTYNGQMLDVNF